eukprot:TRINITY_DN14981_c0_g2_i2.p1 TRINITY_DN14981_c0_g2~~TRINITY_DN14981_c0_g2_i2.p1  ORF type:complete len:556 (-),score=68.81 TRINITY_DN14981_c0_g2_i2:45-1712(-)
MCIRDRESGCPMTCSSIDTKRGFEDAQYEKPSLVSKHAYILMEVKEEMGTKRKQKVVKVRNPWGKLEWAGTVGTMSNCMPKTIEEKGEGVFHMNFEDFYKYFKAVVICKYQPNFGHKTISLSLEENLVEYYMKVKVDQESDVYFQILLDFKKESVPLSIVFNSIMVGYRNPNNKSVEYIASEQFIANRLFVERTLKKDKYIFILIIRDALKHRHSKATFALSAKELSTIKQVTKQSKKTSYLCSLLRTYIAKEIEQEYIPSHTDKIIFSLYSAELYLNFSTKTTLHVNTKYTNPGAVKVIPALEEGKLEVIVEPGKEKLVCIKGNNEPSNYICTQNKKADISESELVGEIRKGNLNVSLNRTIERSFSYKCYYHDFGYVLEVVNFTSNIILYIQFEFAPRNLKLVGGNRADRIRVKLQPKETKYAFFRAEDPSNPSDLNSCLMTHKSQSTSISKERIIRELKETGREDKLKANAAIYSKDIDLETYFLITNDTGKTLTVEIKFTSVTNLEWKEGEACRETLKPEEKEQIKAFRHKDVIETISHAAVCLKYLLIPT